MKVQWVWITVVGLVFVVVTPGCRSESEPQPSDAGATDETAPVAEEISVGEDWAVPGLGMQFVWVADMKCWVGKYEVTNEEYREFKPEHGLRGGRNFPHFYGRSLADDRQPVVYVWYDDVVAYAEWLTERERQAGRLPDGLKYRLPDGDEWTTFAQCGDGRTYPWGNEWPPKYGNYFDKAGRKVRGGAGRFLGKEYGPPIKGYNDRFGVACPVEKSGKNDWGLYGVAGNVSELTSGPKSLKWVSVRGASWNHYLQEALPCESRENAYREKPYGRKVSIGFRLLLAR